MSVGSFSTVEMSLMTGILADAIGWNEPTYTHGCCFSSRTSTSNADVPSGADRAPMTTRSRSDDGSARCAPSEP